MSVKNSFIVVSNNNTEIISLQEWVATLNGYEQELFRQADMRQVKHRQNAIDKGDMIIDSVTKDYVWRDIETAKKGKPTDRVWLEFWNRYVDECNLVTGTKFKEE